MGRNRRGGRGAAPGDELLEAADGIATRAITIDAPTEAVWPWLAQLGPSPRGGAYTYDWIENLLGLHMHNVDRVLPEFQHPTVGDTIGFGKHTMRVERVELGHVLAWRSEDDNWVWTFVLRQHDQTTRLISRNRLRLPGLAARVGMLPMEPASLLMERKMLLGIKKRAEVLNGRYAKASRTAWSIARCTFSTAAYDPNRARTDLEVSRPPRAARAGVHRCAESDDRPRCLF